MHRFGPNFNSMSMAAIIFLIIQASCAIVAIGQDDNDYNVTYAMAMDAQTQPPFDPIDITEMFSTFDEKAFNWIKFERLYNPHSIEWRWYSPNNVLYYQESHQIPDPNQGNGEYWEDYVAGSQIVIRGADAESMPGPWSIEVYEDGQYVLTIPFQIFLPPNSVSQSIAMSSSTAPAAPAPTGQPAIIVRGIRQTALNWVSVSGANNTIGQGISQGAVGSGIRQIASNWASVSGTNNVLNQGIKQNAVGRGIRQTASNWASVSGTNNKVNQGIEQNAVGSGIRQSGSNEATISGSNNNANQHITQNARGFGITQTGGNIADISGSGNNVNQEINQNAVGGGITQSGGNYVHVSGSGTDVSIKEDQSAIGGAETYSGGVYIESYSS